MSVQIRWLYLAAMVHTTVAVQYQLTGFCAKLTRCTNTVSLTSYSSDRLNTASSFHSLFLQRRRSSVDQRSQVHRNYLHNLTSSEDATPLRAETDTRAHTHITLACYNADYSFAYLDFWSSCHRFGNGFAPSIGDASISKFVLGTAHTGFARSGCQLADAGATVHVRLGDTPQGRLQVRLVSNQFPYPEAAVPQQRFPKFS